jgi:ABC-type antimicrobial peptide transport system permease subunit
VKRDSLSGTAEPSLYLPMSQSFAQEMIVVIRADSDADVSRIAPALRGAVAEVDPTVPVSDVRSLDGFVADSAARARFATTLLALFAAVALLLGATGIYGLMTSAVSRRTREIGVRMALGATTSVVRRQVVSEGTKVVLVGVAIGVVAALASTRLLGTLLYGVKAVDPLVFAAMSVLMVGIGVLASYMPARRASNVDPIEALRSD